MLQTLAQYELWHPICDTKQNLTPHAEEVSKESTVPEDNTDFGAQLQTLAVKAANTDAQ